MGITIVQKSDLSHPKPDPKIALVLSGGGISGGAFKLGGLRVLNSFMLNRKIEDFDLFVGVSAGAMISAYLANGISVDDVSHSLEGMRGILDPIRASELYALNYMDILTIPSRVLEHSATIILRGVPDFLMANNIFKKDFRKSLLNIISRPGYGNVRQFVKDCLRRKELTVRQTSLPWHFIPNGIFRTDKFEQSNRENLENNDLCNDFRSLYKKKGKELYIIATNLNTAERVIFGHDYVHNVLISKAMQASIAIPLFYKPVTIGDADYVDGAVVKTASMDLAITKDADLIICYNPFRPFNCDSFSMHYKEENGGRFRIAEDGIYAVLNQVMRSMLHTRLMHGIDLYRKDPDFKGDIILFQPTEYDNAFFEMNPMSFRERRKAAKRGFESVKGAINGQYDILKKILNAHGIEVNPEFRADLPDMAEDAFWDQRETVSGI